MSETQTININLEPGTPEELVHALKVIIIATIVVMAAMGLFIWGWIEFHGVEWTNSCAYGVMKC